MFQVYEVYEVVRGTMARHGDAVRQGLDSLLSVNIYRVENQDNKN